MSTTLKLPDGSADCHVHIYGPFDRFPAHSEGRFTPTRETPVETLFAMWDEIGVSRGVIVHALAAGADNEVTLDALKRYPDKLRAVAVLQNDVTDKRLDELTAAGFKGARVNMLRQDGKPVSAGGMDFEGLKKVAPRLAERGWHAQLWIETGDLDAMASEIKALPLNFVIDHMGRTMADKGVGYPGFQAFLERLKTGRYWCKISGADRNTRTGAPYGDTEPFMQAIVNANPDRLVWGSDWPHVGHTPESYPAEQTLIGVLFRCVPDEAVRRKILVDNPTALYGF
jgi:predicted TIM-barrel fold metal-dependent hydrolase